MAFVAYTRLHTEAERVGREHADDHRCLYAAHLFADAWAYIDAIHRTGEFLDQFLRDELKPKPLKGFKGPLYERDDIEVPEWVAAFLRARQSAVMVRNNIQHARSRQARAASLETPINGVLRWLVVDPNRSHYDLFTVLSGTVHESKIAPFDGLPGLADCLPGVDHIRLHVHDNHHDLTESFVALRALALDLEQVLAPTADAHKPAGTDIVLSTRMVPAASYGSSS